MANAKLQDILAEYGAILLEVDAAGGEVEDHITARLEEAEGGLCEKLERISSLVESFRAKAKSVRERCRALQSHAQALEARAERIHDWAVAQLENAGITAYETDSYSWRRRANPQKLEIENREDLLEYLWEYHRELVKTEFVLDNKGVLDLAKKEGGIPGASVGQGHHWRVS